VPIRILGISGSPISNSNTKLLLQEALSSIEGPDVGWYRNSGIETTLTSLHLSFLTYQMLSAVPGTVCTFGGAGAGSLGGTGRFDPKDKSQVLQDEFGLMTARETAKGVVELIEAVKKGLS